MLRDNMKMSMQKASFNTGYAGLAVTARIPVNFGAAHGRSRPEVGSAKCIGAYGRKGVTPSPP